MTRIISCIVLLQTLMFLYEGGPVMVTLFCGFGYMVVLLFVLICLWLRKKGVARFSAL